MKKAALIAFLCAGLVATSAVQAHADVVSDRVLLTTGASGCSGGTGFRRIVQDPNGGETYETAEYQVPAGKYLEITSIEIAMPYWTAYAKGMTQAFWITINRRSNASYSSSVFTGQFQNAPIFVEDASGQLNTGTLRVAPGARTQTVTFPVGPLMSPKARLCMTVSDNGFWTFLGAAGVRVRGRLVDSGSTGSTPPGGVLGQ